FLLATRESTMKRLLGFAVIGLWFGALTNPAHAAGKVHAVLVLDTNGPSLQKAATEDGNLVTSFLEGGIGKEFLSISKLSGNQVTLENLKRHLDTLGIERQRDTLVCYVACHGATDKQSGEHVLQFHGSGSANSEYVRRRDLRAALQAMDARLTVLLT